jgi:hypothetical protein
MDERTQNSALDKYEIDALQRRVEELEAALKREILWLNKMAYLSRAKKLQEVYTEDSGEEESDAT